MKVVVRFATALWPWVLLLCQKSAGAVPHAVSYAAAVTDGGIEDTLSYEDALVPQAVCSPIEHHRRIG